MDRAFVSLTRENYDDFKRGKKWEIRRRERGWTEKNIYTGRLVTVCYAYRAERFEGTIGKVIVGNLRDILRLVPYKEIEPRAANVDDAWLMNWQALGNVSNCIAFEIISTKKAPR